VSRILDAIGDAVEQVDIIRDLPPPTKFFRGRVGPVSRPYRTARRLGPPPPHKAAANRMSPAGIPMFYGALDESTAVAETIHGRLKKGEIVCVGSFLTVSEVRVLDLTALPPVPSLFSHQRDLRPVLKFLHAFVHDLSKPIKKDGREHVEYVPTQIVTEYFRHSYLCPDGKPVEGVLYPSARIRGGIACVLFVTRANCGIRESNVSNKKQSLRFLTGSAKVFRRKPRKKV
jgi:hypothetical protein